MARKKVLLVEVNEVTWNLIDPLIEQGLLPTFAQLKREGAWASPMSVDLPPPDFPRRPIFFPGLSVSESLLSAGAGAFG